MSSVFKVKILYFGSCNFGLLCGLSFLLILASCFNLSSNICCIVLFLVWSRGLLLWCTPGAPAECHSYRKGLVSGEVSFGSFSYVYSV